MGATCDKDGHDKFNEFFHELTSGKSEDHPIPVSIGKIECPIPPEGLVYDYLFEQKGRGKWTLWLDLIKDKGIDPSVKRLSEIIVPTMDTARYTLRWERIVRSLVSRPSHVFSMHTRKNKEGLVDLVM